MLPTTKEGDVGKRMPISDRGLLCCFAVLIVGIVVLSLIPKFPAIFDRNIDGVLFHTGAYGVLAFLPACWLAKHHISWWRSMSSLVLMVIAIGGLIETLQEHVPIRTAQASDLGWDILGGFVGVLLGGLTKEAHVKINGGSGES